MTFVVTESCIKCKYTDCVDSLTQSAQSMQSSGSRRPS